MLGSSFLLAALGLTGAAWIRRQRRDAWVWTGTAAGCLAVAILTGPATVEERSPERAPCEAHSADTGANQTALSPIHGAQRRDQISEAKTAALSPPHVRPQAETEA